ncbi:MAG: glycosyltransferase family 2 protein [Clostridiales bacterium]|nr:glycosyltransferase family 2 protein [Clostridiales bacterium]
MKLSVCLIVKDEEEVLPRCLNSIKDLADEIIIVDTGSTDDTVKIAKSYGAQVFSFAWVNDFSKARNFSFSKANCDYIMWLDADDVVSEQNAKKIINLKGEMQNFDVIFLNYCAAFENGTPTFVYSRERIFRKNCNFKWEGMVHEAVSARGKIKYSDAEIHHKKIKKGEPLRNLKIYQSAIARGICLTEREKFYYGRELYFNKMYLEAAAVLSNFLKGEGWVQNKIEATLNLYNIYKILGDEKKAFKYLFKGLLYAPPTSEFCCILGEHFISKNDFNSAIYWYERALLNKISTSSGAFINLDYYRFIPYIQLCVIYDRQGDYKTAQKYNEQAGKIKPKNKSYLANKRYFENLKSQGKL